jgi:HTH-type transcriptional regulator/antitoxin HigA
MSSAQNQFNPDYCVRPGEILCEALEERSLSQNELAQRTGRSPKMINEIVQGKAPITSDTALQLERVLGIQAKFWLNLQTNFDAFETKAKERDRLCKSVNWLKSIPIAAMIKNGWISAFGDPVLQLQEVLNFYGIASPELWQEHWLAPKVAYKTSPTFTKDPGATSAWLRRGDILAQKIECAPYDAKAFRAAIIRLRELTLEPQQTFLTDIQTICARCGVAVVFVPCIPKAPVSGAARWLSANKAVIQLSLRHGTDDHFWFTFFHEVAHILLHGKREQFIDNEDEFEDLKVSEANAFASDTLMPPQQLQEFVASRKFDKKRVTEFANLLGIAPGIVVGKLQRHKLVGFDRLNELKRSVSWTKN